MTTPATAGTMTAPKEPQPLRPEVREAIQRTAKQHLGEYADDFFEKWYQKRDENMDAAWKAQLHSFHQATEKLEHYNDLTGGKNIVGAALWHKVQPRATAKTVSDGLKAFTGDSRFEKTLNLEDAGSGGTLVQGEVLDFFFEPLRANSVVYSLGPRRSPMVNDQGTLTGFETDSTITWVNEVNTSQEIVSEPTTGNRTYSAKKARLAIPISNDLLGSTLGPRIAREIEEQAIWAFTIGFDDALITSAGTLWRPKGLRNWALAANEVASSGQLLTNIFQDYRDGLNAIESLNVPRRNMGQIMAPRTKNHLWLGALNADDEPALRLEMQTGSLFGVPWRATTNVPTNLGAGTNESYIILADFSQVVIKEGQGLEIARSQEASWTQSSTVHLPMEEDVTVIWAKNKIDMVVPHPEAVYVITGVQYGT